uniref:Uncharacterized protein n=1 Tax=Anguilla anguilla TaxID=7936 RepID=A0A0E9UEB3_ANGAN
MRGINCKALWLYKCSPFTILLWYTFGFLNQFKEVPLCALGSTVCLMIPYLESTYELHQSLL